MAGRSTRRRATASTAPRASSSPPPNTTEAALAASLRQAEAVTQIHEAAFASRPKNMQKAWLPRQKEFKASCDEVGFADTSRYTVTPDELAYFLKKCVVGRAKKRGGRKKRGASAEDEEENGEEVGAATAHSIGWQTVDQYIAAMVNLYQDQQRAGINSQPHPRTGAVREIIATMRHSAHAKKRLEFHDRGAGTYLDGYNSTDQLATLATYNLSRNNPEGLRDHAMYMLSNFGLLRGHHVREADFADFHSVVLENEGYTRCVALVLVLDHGKTNQNGRLEMAGMMRSKNFLVCPLFALALHFYQLHIANNAYPPDEQSFPSFAASPDWYNLKAFPSPSDLEEPLKYQTHRTSVTKTHKNCGVISKVVTHLPRGAAARMADLGGAPEDSIRRAGRWDQGALTSCYLMTLPRESMRVLAGFAPTGGDFFLPRDVEVPEALLSQIFPQVEDWIKRQKTGDRCEPNIAANGFLCLLRELRSVLVQDLVQLRKVFPTFFIFNHPLFSSSAFAAYEAHALRTIATQDDPADVRLRQALPLLASRMEAGFAALAQDARERRSRDAQSDKILSAVATAFGDIFSGVAPVRLMAEWSGSGSNTEPSVASSSPSRNPPPPSPSSSHSTAPAPRRPVAAPAAQSPNLNPLQTLAALTSNTIVPASHITSGFKMSRTVETVADLWREYDEGIGGRPSVRSQYEARGHSWSGDDSERKYYQRRIVVIKEVKRIAQAVTVRESIVAAKLDDFRRSEKLSISKLESVIKMGPLSVSI